MEVDAANATKRKAEELDSNDDDLLKDDVAPEHGMAALHSAASADPDEQRRLQLATSSNQGQKGGKTALQAAPQAPQPTAAQAAATQREERAKTMHAELLSEARATTVAEAAAVEAEACDENL